MNIIPASVVAMPGGLAIELLGQHVPVAPRHHAALQGLKQVGVGIRPHALRLVSPAPGRIMGRVFLREPLGLEDEVLVEMANGTQVKVVAAAGEEFPERAAVGLDFAPADLYLFHPESRAALCHGIA
jgi:hypothetical protein